MTAYTKTSKLCKGSNAACKKLIDQAVDRIQSTERWIYRLQRSIKTCREMIKAGVPFNSNDPELSWQAVIEVANERIAFARSRIAPAKADQDRTTD